MAGISTSIIVPRGAWTPHSPTAAAPVIMPPVPAYSSAAMLRCSVVGVPVTARNTPGSSRCHGPPARSRWCSALVVIPCASTWLRLMT